MLTDVDPPKRAWIVIELELESDPITGRIREPPDGRAFVGWLALVRALEHALGRSGGHVDDE